MGKLSRRVLHASVVLLFPIISPWSFSLNWAAMSGETDETAENHYSGEPVFSPHLLRGIPGTEFIEELKAYEQ